jgi:prepilin-type N-terminal cleavage/methylation domain-containing protein
MQWMQPWVRTRTRVSYALRRGLSLVELMAVAVILGVLALIIVPNIVQSLHTTKSAALATTLATV